jgi:DNA processing protein
MTERIAKDLACAGVTLVSGLARGIDTACHRVALREGGRTIGVLGCGIDVTYPRENKSLIEEIVQSGAVITEFRPGVPPLATNFFRRNRIVSGLSRGVVVVEAADNSGSLITANHAVDQNRDVFAVPGNVLNLRSRGPHRLLKQGAALTESAQDVLEALFSNQGQPVQAQLLAPPAPNDALPDTARRVLEAMDPDPVPIDFLCETLGMEPGRLSGILLELELGGLIRQHPGKMFSRRQI